MTGGSLLWSTRSIPAPSKTVIRWVYTHISKVSVDSTVEWNVQMVDIDLVQWNVISVDSAVEKMFNLYSR